MGKYFDTKAKYYNTVIQLYSEGKSGREIAKAVPVSDSTIYRWVSEHLEKCNGKSTDNIAIPRTPVSVAKTIRAMHARIVELECRLEIAEKKNEVLEQISLLLKETKFI